MATEWEQAMEKEEFRVTRLRPEKEMFYEDSFSLFLVQVKTDSDTGRRYNDHPLSVFRDRAPEMGIEEGARAHVLRVNAEISANPVRKSAVWAVIPGSTTAVGVEYKYDD